MKQWILSLEKVDKACYNCKRENGERLIVSYSDKRAKKDAYNRDRGIARLRKAYKTGRITKSQVNKRGYNKFLEISKDLTLMTAREKEVEETERFLSNIDNVLINGIQLLLDQVYDSIGFNRIPDEILRHLVIARVSQPRSKLATVDYLKSYYDEDVDLNHIYRYMDKLYNTQMELAQQISVEHTRKLFGGKIGLMFYDVTTLYFETAQTDVLREAGFSKDGKTAESQVVLGLLVSEGGYPLSYSLFNGSQYEGFTMIPMIDDFK